MIVPTLDLAVTKIIAPSKQTDGKYYVGDVVEYIITATNPVVGSELFNVNVSDTLPIGMTFVAGSATVTGGTNAAVTESGNTINVTATSMTDTTPITVKLKAMIVSGENTTLKNVAVATGVDNATLITPIVISNGEADIIVQPSAQLLLSKIVSESIHEDGKYYVGDTVEYTITASNPVENTALYNIKVSDILPKELLLVKGSAYVVNEDEVKVIENENSVEVNMVSLSVSNPVILKLKATIVSGEGTTISNIAIASAMKTPESGDPELKVETLASNIKVETGQLESNLLPDTGNKLRRRT